MLLEKMDAHKKEALLKKYSASLMSDHKWQKLYLAMAEYGSDLQGIEYRFTDTKRILTDTAAPGACHVYSNQVDIFPAPGHVEFRHIESISIPYIYTFRAYKNAALTEKVQDIEPFLKALDAIGQFPVVKEHDRLIVRGYAT